MTSPTIQPSHTVHQVSAAYDVVLNYKRPAHGLRAKGTGTVTIKTLSGDSEQIDVNDGELVPCQFTNIVALGGGTTAVRIHIPPT